eukprot:9485699-Pyramimonas_sp.AAC.1
MSIPVQLRAPSHGCDLVQWLYREGNSRADNQTWLARRGQSHYALDPRIYTTASETIRGIRGYFDGGRSAEGSGGGLVLDLLCNLLLLLTSNAFQLAHLPPTGGVVPSLKPFLWRLPVRSLKPRVMWLAPFRRPVQETESTAR